MNQFAKPGLAEEKLPPVGTSDNGKVLGVSEGAWAKIPAPSGLPEIGEGDTGKVLTATAEGAAWQSGGGSGGGVLVVGLDMQTFTLDTTWQEIYDAMAAGKIAYIYLAMETEGSIAAAGYVVVNAIGASGTYAIAALAIDNGAATATTFATDSAGGYPVWQV